MAYKCTKSLPKASHEALIPMAIHNQQCSCFFYLEHWFLYFHWFSLFFSDFWFLKTTTDLMYLKASLALSGAYVAYGVQ